MIKIKKIINFSDWPKFYPNDISTTKKILLSGKITSNAMIAAHESFNLSIIGTYTVLSNGNLHIFQTVFSSISTITISLDILLGWK